MGSKPEAKAIAVLTRRRWFRFSLRTMFAVVTIVGIFIVWLRSELNFVHARRDFAFTEGMGRTTDNNLKPPFWRRWLGDKAVESWRFPHDAPEENLARARDLFPEAEIVRLEHDEDIMWTSPPAKAPRPESTENAMPPAAAPNGMLPIYNPPIKSAVPP